MQNIARKLNESCQEFIERLAKENREYYGTQRGVGLLKELGQKFPHTWIYVAELIQNAVDEKATHIRFAVEDSDALVFEHNGEPFDFEKDIVGLCTKGISSKGAGTVGFMGVGFKSVFRSFEKVRVSSGGWSFFLHVPLKVQERFGDRHRNWADVVCPVWDDSIAPPSEGMTCRFELVERCVRGRSIQSDLNAVFKNDLALLPLLARQGITVLEWMGTLWNLSISQRQTFQSEDGERLHIEAKSSKQDKILKWIVFSQEYAPTEAAVRRFLEHRQLYSDIPEEQEKIYTDASRTRRVEAFFQVGDDGFPKLHELGEAYAVLPTNIKLPVGVDIQADWLLTQSRQEFMDDDAKTNPWHREITNNIAKITKQYFRWLVSAEGPGARDGTFNILPALDERSVEQFSWFLGLQTGKPVEKSIYCLKLIQELKNEPFLPHILSVESTKYISPESARVLPKPLNDRCGENVDMRPWLLFGRGLVSIRLIGQAAADTLSKIGLLTVMSAADLETHWGKDVVKTWVESYPKEERFGRLETLLSGLTLMSREEVTWEKANLNCLPAEQGPYISRNEALRFPADWAVLNNEPAMMKELQAAIGDSTQILQWEFDRFLIQRPRSVARLYIDAVKQHNLGDLVRTWWANLPSEALSTEQLTNVLKFTHWACTIYSQRKDLVPKVLCKGSDKILRLLPLEETVLEAPYAESYRKAIFPEYPSISPVYYQMSSTIRWKTFFESAASPPLGRFLLEPVIETKYPWDFQSQTGIKLPCFRSSPIAPQKSSYAGATVDNNKATIVNYRIPNKVMAALSVERDPEQKKCAYEWIKEEKEQLVGYSKVRILYIPAYESRISELPNQLVPFWMQQLAELPWVFANQGDELYRPRDILLTPDPARPDAPVALSFPETLARVFEDAEIRFGEAIPKAGPVRELQVYGPMADLPELCEIIQGVQKVILEDPRQLPVLKQTLSELPLIPVPEGISLIDGARRVSLSRIVKKAGGARSRGGLNWVLVVGDLEEDPLYKEFFETMAEFFPIPEKTTAMHAMELLQWIWKNDPEAETVRRVLPLAYAYILEDLRDNEALKNQWETIAPQAKVYTLNRRWVMVRNDATIYFDDVNLADSAVIPKNILVPPSHLGSNNQLDEQRAAARLLGISLVSQDYAVRINKGVILPIEPSFSADFSSSQIALAEALQQSISMEDPEEDADAGEPNVQIMLVFQRVESLWQQTVSLKTNEVVVEAEVFATKMGNAAIVSGGPVDFASELCSVLLRHFNVNRRRNIERIASDTTILLSQIGQSDFSRHLAKFKKKYGITDYSSAPVGEQPEPIPKAEQALVPKPERTNESVSEPNPESTQEPRTGSEFAEPASMLERIRLAREEEASRKKHIGKCDSTENVGGQAAIGQSGSVCEPRDRPAVVNNGNLHNHSGEGSALNRTLTAVGGPPVVPRNGTAVKEEKPKHHAKGAGRLISYVYSTRRNAAEAEVLHQDGTNEESDALRIGRAAESAAMEFERKRNWSPVKMDHNNPGYDIESRGPSGEFIYIEVKGSSGAWGEAGVALSPTQFEHAQKHGKAAWLYVVENIDAPDQQNVYAIQDPAGQVTEFRFDYGWKGLCQSGAESGRLAMIKLQEGNKILYKGRKAVVKEVDGHGALTSVLMEFEDGTTTKAVFDPDQFEFIKEGN